VLDKYTDCPECGHHRSVHTNRAIWWDDDGDYYCSYGTPGDQREHACFCKKTQKDIDAHVATFDTRTCELCGLGNVTQSRGGSVWSHGSVHDCMRAMGKKIREMEREMFSRRSAIRDQKEKQNG